MADSKKPIEPPEPTGGTAADQQDQRANERVVPDARPEGALDEQEFGIDHVNAQADGRRAQVQGILDDAEARDEQADVRDCVAAGRDSAADLESFLDPDTDYSASLQARRSAAMDRSDSRVDRLSAADDRSKLTPDHNARADGDDG
ncbi:hypothetical protein LL946_10450 [Knoellia locipacati]|uniref:hypothetical protein n=1 Tax=Knoellia locipacati TaxID=882824 RepID=UPI00384B2DEE